jgi:hypothetical protein
LLLETVGDGQYHLIQSDEPEAQGRIVGRRKQFENGIKGHQKIGPAVTGTEYLPGAQKWWR